MNVFLFGVTFSFCCCSNLVARNTCTFKVTKQILKIAIVGRLGAFECSFHLFTLFNAYAYLYLDADHLSLMLFLLLTLTCPFGIQQRHKHKYKLYCRHLDSRPVVSLLFLQSNLTKMSRIDV